MVEPRAHTATPGAPPPAIERSLWTLEQRDLFARIGAHPFEQADQVLDFTGRLARDRGWSLSFARGAVTEYRRFCFLAMVFDTPVTPSEEVDEVWHQHLAYSRDYWDVWCGRVLGRRLHHDPTEGGPAEGARYRAQYAETLARYEAWFGPPDAAYWPATHCRFRSRPRYRIVDGDRVITLRKPALPSWFRRAALSSCLVLSWLGAGLRPAAAVPLGALDWTAGPFLTLYATLMAAALLAALIGRQLLLSTRKSPPSGELDPVEIALLAGGPDRAADTVVIGLIETGAAAFSPSSGGTLTVEQQGVALPRWLEPFRGAAAGTTSRKPLISEVKFRVEPMRRRLVEFGLVPSRERLDHINGWTLLCAVPVLMFGLAKVFVGLSRAKPVGFLAILVLVMTVATVLLLVRTPLRTRMGRRMLTAYTLQHARAARAPRDGELLFAFALGGAAILAGTQHEAYAQAIRLPSSGGSGCGSSGGDGGGGGGGGCGGCGGGGD